MPEILKNVRLFCGGADLTTANNKLEVAAEAAEKDVTTYGDYDPATDSVWQVLKAGQFSGQLTASGFWEAQDTSKVDDTAWEQLGGLSAWTWCPDGANVGDVGWPVKAMEGSYKLLDAVGEVAPWEAQAKTTWPMTRGKILHPPGTARVATGSGTAVQHVAVAADQRLYASLHVLSVSGTAAPTITVTVQSDVDNTFGSPATQVTFAAATARGGQILRAAGPVTDTWWRAAWTITGTDPSFLFVAAIGIA